MEKIKNNEKSEIFEKIVVLDTETQACLIKPLLEEQNIPCFFKSYRDAAYDGLFQSSKGWGHIEAPPQFKEIIIKIKEGLIH